MGQANEKQEQDIMSSKSIKNARSQLHEQVPVEFAEPFFDRIEELENLTHITLSFQNTDKKFDEEPFNRLYPWLSRQTRLKFLNLDLKGHLFISLDLLASSLENLKALECLTLKLGDHMMLEEFRESSVNDFLDMELEGFPLILESSLKKLKNLKVLDLELHRAKWNPQGVEAFMKGLESLKNLNSLTLDFKQASGLEESHVVSILNSISNLENLNVLRLAGTCWITKDLPSFKVFKSVKLLGFDFSNAEHVRNGVKFNDEGLTIIGNTIKGLQNLSHLELDCRFTDSTDQGFEIFSEALESLNSLTHLKLKVDDFQVTETAAKPLLAAISKLPLKSLNIYGRSLIEDSDTFYTSLKPLKDLRELHVFINLESIDPILIKIADLISELNGLQGLHLHTEEVKLHEKTVEKLACSLGKSPILEKLHLNIPSLSEDDVTVLFSKLANSNFINDLKLKGHQSTYPVPLETYPTLSNLESVYICCESNASLEQSLKALKKCKKLQELRIENNDLNELGLRQIGQYISQMPALRRLYLITSDPEYTQEQLEEFRQALGYLEFIYVVEKYEEAVI